MSTAEELQRFYRDSLNTINEQMREATTPEFIRLTNEVATTNAILEELGKVLEEPRLKLFHVFVTFPQSMATQGPTNNKVEMTVLATNESEADSVVTKILDREGYTDLSATLINISEIEGPFESGFVISRYGG